MKFVKTTDQETARELGKYLKLINNQNGVWTFLNETKLHFNDENKKKITYSDILTM